MIMRRFINVTTPKRLHHPITPLREIRLPDGTAEAPCTTFRLFSADATMRNGDGHVRGEPWNQATNFPAGRSCRAPRSPLPRSWEVARRTPRRHPGLQHL